MPKRSNEKAPKKKRGVIVRVLRGVGFTFLGLAILVVGLLVFLHSGPGREMVRKRVHQRLSAALNGTADLDTLRYSLFDGTIAVEGLRIRDEKGAEAVALDKLEISAELTSLLKKQPHVRSVAVHGLRVHAKQAADGTSSLASLVKKPPPGPPASGPPPKPPEPLKRVQVDSLVVDGVQYTVEKADGTIIAVDKLSLSGHADGSPANKDLEAAVLPIEVDLHVDRADGVKLKVAGLKTGVKASMKGGEGTVTLEPTSAHVTQAKSGEPTRELDISLGSVSLGLAPGKIDATLAALAAGALALEKVELRAGVTDGKLAGDQRGSIVGLHASADKLNALLPKPVLATDVDVAVKLDGPVDRLALDLGITTKGGNISLKGTVDVSRLDMPGYDLKLQATDLGSERLIHSDKVPPATVSSLTVGLKGKGIQKETIATDVSIDLAKTRIRGLDIDSLAVRGRLEKGQLTITSLKLSLMGDELDASGTFALESKELHLKTALRGDVRRTLRALKDAGVKAPERLAGLALLGDLELSVDGKVGDALAVKVTRAKVGVAGGTVDLDADVRLLKHDPDADGKTTTVTGMHANVDLRGVRVSGLMAIAGRPPPAVDGTLSGHVVVEGTPKDPSLDAALALRGKGLVVRANATARGGRADVHASADRTFDKGADQRLLTLDASLPLVNAGGTRRLAPEGKMRLDLDVKRTRLEDLYALVPPEKLEGKKLPSGEVEAKIALTGTPASPHGTITADLLGVLIKGRNEPQHVHLDAKVTPGARGPDVNADAGVWLDAKDAREPVKAHVEAHFDGTPLTRGTAWDVAWKVLLDLPARPLRSLPSDKLAVVEGDVEAHIALSGTRNDAKGTVRAAARGVRAGALGPLEATVGLDLEDAEARLDVHLDGPPGRLVSLGGKAGLGGHGLLARVREKTLVAGAIPLSFALDVPDREIAAFEFASPRVKGLPGHVKAHIGVDGTPDSPLLSGGVTYDRFTTITGAPGQVELRLAGLKDALRATLAVGAKDEVTIALDAPPLGQILKQKSGTLEIGATARARQADLGALLPGFAVSSKLGVKGELDWAMGARVSLAVTPEGRKLEKAALTGTLALTKARLQIPGSSRMVDGVELKLSATEDALRIDSLAASEQNARQPLRTIRASGALAWKNLRPTGAHLDVHAKDWLVHGGQRFGEADAPRGELSADVSVDADISTPVRKIRAAFTSLDLRVPERFPRSHQPEVLGLGDVLYVDEGAVVGSMKVPVKPGEAAEAKAKPAPAEPGSGTELDLVLPAGTHLQQAPLDLWGEGAIHASIRPDAKSVTGKITMRRGTFYVLGKHHELDHGDVFFDEKDPGGRMELHFKRRPHVAPLRTISAASADGEEVRVSLIGPMGKQKAFWKGTGNAFLFEAASLENDGRNRWTAEPGTPASQTVQGPGQGQVVLSTFMSVNLPHLLFLDRISYWGAPASYGRFENVDAEAYSKDGKRRLHVVRRPDTIGESEGEVGLDWLWVNTSRVLAGAGVRGGTRGGGGPGLFFEWSSAD